MDIEGPHHSRGVGGEVIVKAPSEDSLKFLCAARKLVSLKGLPQEIETKNFNAPCQLYLYETYMAKYTYYKFLSMGSQENSQSKYSTVSRIFFISK
jgi:hypothetical protein